MLDPRTPGPDYTLRWPRELFQYEARALAASVARSQDGWSDQVLLLLEEAFSSDQPGIDFQAGDFRVAAPPTGRTRAETLMIASEAWTEFQQDRPSQFLHQLIRATDRLPEAASPRPYYGMRAQAIQPTAASDRNLEGAKQAWSVFVTDLLQRGYLDRVVGRPCVDDSVLEAEWGGQGRVLNRVLTDHLGGDRLWNRVPSSWREAEFFGMIEVVHDLVARPRRRWYHSFNDCGWHYSAFAVPPAQILYRWTVNRILAQHRITLRLAKSGEDVGRLVQTTDSAREDLIAAAIAHGGPSVDPIKHAIALYRVRDADTESKRSACIALFGVLESRRELLKSQLLTKDEVALFEIANKFGIRHQKANQRRDYDQIYLDWIFWWCLATVELSSRLLARQGGSDD